MTELLKEHRPLLCEDISDEELLKNSLQRRHMGYRGRARNNIKGAATIIKNWPDHWTSSLTAWWLSIGMLAATVFIIYNLFISYAMLPTTYSKPVTKIDGSFQRLHLPDIFMHIVVNNDKEPDLSKFLPYIEIMADKYLNYKFNLLILFNDTHFNEKSSYREEINNENAINSLWTANSIHKPYQKKSNINIQYKNLSSYFNSSPLRKHWKHIPNQLIDFSVRALSVWDKGGITFDPVILTPKSPNAVYIEKLQNILETYQKDPKVNDSQRIDSHSHNIKQKKINSQKLNSKRRVNNIRDIIEALDTDIGSHSQTEVLSVAEDMEELTAVEKKPLLNEYILNTINNKDSTVYNNLREALPKVKNEISFSAENNSLQTNTTVRSQLLPLFLDFLFHDHSKEAEHQEMAHKNTKRYVLKRNHQANPSKESLKNDQEANKLQTMIIPPPTNFGKPITTKKEDYIKYHGEDEEKLTIDINGILISTRIPCHAFIGSVFNDVKHCGNEELLKDFIISELSLFCKGLLSTCKGIDVVLI